MKNKKIIIALIAILLICVGIGAVQVAQSKDSAQTTSGIVTTNESTSIKSESTTAQTTTKKNTTATATVATTANKTGTTSASTSSKATTKSATTAKKSTTKATTTAKSKNTVCVTISCKNAINYGANVPQYMLKQTSIKINDGDTAFDVLKAACKQNNIALDYESSMYGIYVVSIGGLSEKDCGSQSGWMYKVNGVTPGKAASSYALSKNDNVEWFYVTSPNDN